MDFCKFRGTKLVRKNPDPGGRTFSPAKDLYTVNFDDFRSGAVFDLVWKRRGTLKDRVKPREEMRVKETPQELPGAWEELEDPASGKTYYWIHTLKAIFLESKPSGFRALSRQISLKKNVLENLFKNAAGARKGPK